MKYRHFILNTGYVEGQSLTQMLLTKTDGSFASISQAIKTLVNDLAQEFEFDITSPDEVFNAIVEFIYGDMQSHGYFLFSREWNTCNFTDIEVGEIVVCIDRAPEIIRDIFFEDINEIYFRNMTHCLEITAKDAAHKLTLHEGDINDTT